MELDISQSEDMIRVLSLLHQAGHTTAIIAGGAIRDRFHGVEVSDIDVYIQYTPNTLSPFPRQKYSGPEWLTYWTSVLKLQTTGYRALADAVDYYYSTYADEEDSNANRVVAVWNVWKNYIKYQIILTSLSPIDYVERHFDFGICKAYCDGTKVRLTRDFITDSQKKSITLVGKNLSRTQCIYAVEDHLPRIQAKYPNHQFKVAPWNEGILAAEKQM
jgi:hypothetical protein